MLPFTYYDYKKKRESANQEQQVQKSNQTDLHSDPEALNSSSNFDVYKHPHRRQKRDKVDYKLENEKLDEPVRSYILPKNSWGLLDGPSVLKR